MTIELCLLTRICEARPIEKVNEKISTNSAMCSVILIERMIVQGIVRAQLNPDDRAGQRGTCSNDYHYLRCYSL